MHSQPCKCTYHHRTVHLETVKTANFAFYIFYHNTKMQIKKHLYNIGITLFVPFCNLLIFTPCSGLEVFAWKPGSSFFCAI